MNYLMSGVSFLEGQLTKGIYQCQLFDDGTTNNKFLAVLKIARVVVHENVAPFIPKFFTKSVEPIKAITIDDT